jgi:hypothetical protein
MNEKINNLIAYMELFKIEKRNDAALLTRFFLKNINFLYAFILTLI